MSLADLSGAAQTAFDHVPVMHVGALHALRRALNAAIVTSPTRGALTRRRGVRSQ
jgi:hypothetical protein